MAIIPGVPGSSTAITSAGVASSCSVLAWGVSSTYPPVVRVMVCPGAASAVRSATVGAIGPRVRPERRIGVLIGAAGSTCLPLPLFLTGEVDFALAFSSPFAMSPSVSAGLGSRRGREGNMPRSSAPAIFGVNVFFSRSPVPRGISEMPRNSTRWFVFSNGR